MTAPALWPNLGPPTIIDLYHGNTGPGGAEIDFAALYAHGVRLVIHKATQGSGFIDPEYARRRPLALAAGLGWEAYHFADNSFPLTQMKHFLAVADLDNTMRGAIDIEPNGRSTITSVYAEGLAYMLDQRLGYQIIRYGGKGYLTPEMIPATPHLRKGPWWWSRYGAQMTWAWLAEVGIDANDLVMWQYTESGTVPGVDGKVDLSYYLLDEPDSLARWPLLTRFPIINQPKEKTMFQTWEAWIAAHLSQVEEAVTVGEAVYKVLAPFIANLFAMRHNPAAMEEFLRKAEANMPQLVAAVRMNTTAEDELKEVHPAG